MFFTRHRQLIRWIIIIASFAIISLILWNTYIFFQKFKEEQRIKMDIWSMAQAEFQKGFLTDDVNPIVDKIILSDSLIPKILVNSERQISTMNIDEQKVKDTTYVNQLIQQFEKENTPITLSYVDPETNETIEIGKLYYGDSMVLNKLKYYPLALLLIIFLFGAVVYFFYRSSKIATQNKLWSGMAKETAHQIGTPLSSLIGWAEILKIEQVNPEYIKEIEKDIDRLQTITERFSKIGSLPTLKKADIVAETITSYEYLKTRSSKLINFSINVPNQPIYVNLNSQLYSWTIENLVKNAIDAMKGKGNLKVEISQLENRVKINVIDSGKGLSKNEFNTIFEPGYTSKKRGWGLGLSLAKRIVEDFHDGKIRVVYSEIGKGTTMQISLKTL
ncbi:PAS domain-containing sensor histidine kinase [Lacinutrix sp. Hel_I_90]|uniref:sensor histidine kinase n=1 Tax=Lacinutrix sp. Hel_I_90 TaxID=1249999 RepID=UPI0005C8BB9A|nr:HAMP domain-containing sensor histidine kinase [Lacinutrix sp. Hel_I_90]